MAASQFYTQLAVSTGVVLLCSLLHFTVLVLLFQGLRAREPLWSKYPLAPMPTLLAAFAGVLAAHAAEIWLFAGLYLLVGALPDLETAVYFSTTSYASVGYGDVLLMKSWRIVGAIEGAVGVVLLGCSTAFLVAVVTELELFEKRIRRPHPPR